MNLNKKVSTTNFSISITNESHRRFQSSIRLTKETLQRKRGYIFISDINKSSSGLTVEPSEAHTARPHQQEPTDKCVCTETTRPISSSSNFSFVSGSSVSRSTHEL